MKEYIIDLIDRAFHFHTQYREFTHDNIKGIARDVVTDNRHRPTSFSDEKRMLWDLSSNIRTVELFRYYNRILDGEISYKDLSDLWGANEETILKIEALKRLKYAELLKDSMKNEVVEKKKIEKPIEKPNVAPIKDKNRWNQLEL